MPETQFVSCHIVTCSSCYGHHVITPYMSDKTQFLEVYMFYFSCQTLNIQRKWLKDACFTYPRVAPGLYTWNYKTSRSERGVVKASQHLIFIVFFKFVWNWVLESFGNTWNGTSSFKDRESGNTCLWIFEVWQGKYNKQNSMKCGFVQHMEWDIRSL